MVDLAQMTAGNQVFFYRDLTVSLSIHPASLMETPAAWLSIICISEGKAYGFPPSLSPRSQNIFCLPPPIYVAREENSKTTDNLCLLRSSKILQKLNDKEKSVISMRTTLKQSSGKFKFTENIFVSVCPRDCK